MSGISKKLVLWGATGAGSGYAPVMPGTAGSAVGIALYLLLSRLPLNLYVLCVGIVLGAAVWLSSQASHLLQHPDPPQVVIDEICGMLVTLAGLPSTWLFTVAGFLLFRVLDVVKPFPANWINDRMHSGLGIVLDDIIAAVYANLILQGVRLVIR
jgi:phosphatidylglycerophosphatase A